VTRTDLPEEISVAGTALGQYQEDETSHPEWSKTHDAVEAGVAAGTTGASAAPGALLGAEAGS
jgi:hypothetical protein